MTTELTTLDDKSLLALVSGGDTSRLNEGQKIAYYRARCEAAGLDPRTGPLMYVKLSGKETLYATKGASDQLASNHGIALVIVSQETEEGIRLVRVRATAKDGRSTEEVGALSIEGLKGEARANALMKCVTKAKRRAILSLCGLGMLDETEVESVPDARPVAQPQARRAEPAVVAAAVAPASVPSMDVKGATVAIPLDDMPASEVPMVLVDTLAKRIREASSVRPQLLDLGAEVKLAYEQGRITLEERMFLGELLKARKAQLITPSVAA